MTEHEPADLDPADRPPAERNPAERGRSHAALTLREATVGDFQAILALNEANVPEVGSTTLQRLAMFRAIAERFVVAVDDDGGLAGFMILLAEDADYDSPNYGWFNARYRRFLYVDRIAVDSGRRGGGIGRALYGIAVAHGRAGGWPLLCAEVNVEPRNDRSLGFHARFGFTPQAEVADPRYDTLKVAMLTYVIDMSEAKVNPSNGR